MKKKTRKFTFQRSNDKVLWFSCKNKRQWNPTNLKYNLEHLDLWAMLLGEQSELLTKKRADENWDAFHLSPNAHLETMKTSYHSPV